MFLKWRCVASRILKEQLPCQCENSQKEQISGQKMVILVVYGRFRGYCAAEKCIILHEMYHFDTAFAGTVCFRLLLLSPPFISQCWNESCSFCINFVIKAYIVLYCLLRIDFHTTTRHYHRKTVA